uniref:Uncharacterized protein n=1 Tax=Arundo donax TaxID=35708 RepID=A0A0A8Y5A4_ARUDO
MLWPKPNIDRLLNQKMLQKSATFRLSSTVHATKSQNMKELIQVDQSIEF